jgi:curli biogenesis system outer membrane secretion channel CsgG
MKSLTPVTLVLTAFLATCALPALADKTPDEPDPVAALEKLTPKPLNQRVAVSIYGFRSEVQSVPDSGATDMFMTALIKSGQFRVVERARLNEGVVQEKRMNAAAMTTGNTAEKKLRGAQYLFEGAVTEANAGGDNKQGGISIGGLTFGGGKSKDSISVDVRILDAESGDVLDSVSVKVPVKGSNVSVGGTAAFAQTLASMHGGSANALTPDVNLQKSHQDGLDETVRAAIDTAVLQLVKRVELPTDANSAN